MSGRRAIVGFLAAIALLTAACTGGDDESNSTPSADGTETTATETATVVPTASPLRTEGPVDEEQDALALERLAQLQGAERTQAFISRDYPLNNFDIATVELHEIIPVLPRDGIRSIDEPNFDSVLEADAWLDPNEPVISFEFNGEARAYPLQILTWHEIVNDVVGGEPVIVTYCPLCNTAIAFKRTVDGQVREFGVSGSLRRNDLIMYDRETETFWQQITGEAIVGAEAGLQLEFLVSQIISWADFRDSFPQGQVLNRDTGRSAPYGENPYPLYDALGSRTLFPIDEFDDVRLDAKERVLAVDLGDDPIAFPFSVLSESILLEAESAGQAVVAFWQPGALSALDEAFIIAGRNIGAAGAFLPIINGAPATFEVRDGLIVDTATGSEWNVLGRSTAGPLEGTQLEAVVSANHFWFAWSVFKPGTRVIAG